MMRFFVVLGLAFFLFGCGTEDQPEEIPSLPVEKKDEPANKEITKMLKPKTDYNYYPSQKSTQDPQKSFQLSEGMLIRGKNLHPQAGEDLLKQ